MIYNPTVIAQILSTQANYIDKKYGQFFYYTDKNQVWYDTQNKGRVQATDIIILQYERYRNNFIPSQTEDFPSETLKQTPSSLLLNYSIVYVVETNCLYKYQNGTWSTIYGIYGSTTVAQTYLPDGTIRTVVADDVTTNGILNDGSVVVRDNNKMICGQLKSDGYTFNVLSLIGGCINLDPSGNVVGNGCLQLNASTDDINRGTANINGDLVVFGNITTVAPENWDKQYRLVTENIQINSTSVIKSGSTLLSGSSLNDVKYDKDTVLDSDVNATTGLIVTSSKLYKDSIINGDILKPPFMFDTDKINTKTINNTVSTNNVEFEESSKTIKIDIDNPFSATGDTCYIITNSSINMAESVEFSDGTQYVIDYIATEGINNTAKIVYYDFNNTVKVLA